MIAHNTILNQLNEKGFVVSKVKGVSMWPLLNQKHTSIHIKKDTVFVKDDCILFLRPNGELVMHRILKIKNDVFLVSGDNQCMIEKVYLDQVKGKLVEYYKKGRTKQLKGFRYRLYIITIRMTRPLRCLRDFSKKSIKKLFKMK